MRNKLTLLIGLLVFAFAANAQKLNTPLSTPDSKIWQPAEKIVKLDRAVPKAAVYTQDFSAGALPTDWQNVDNSSSGLTWSFDNPGERVLNSTTADNGFAIIDSDYFGGSNEDADLISPVIDCSSLTVVELNFQHFFKSGYGGAGVVSVSGDNGATWTEVAAYGAADTDNAAAEKINITSIAAGQSEVMVKFNWTGSWSWYWAIDDFAVSQPDANDEFAISNITAVSILEANAANTLSATVTNFGVTTQTKTVSFQVDGVEVGTATSASLAYGESETVTFDWTPTAASFDHLISAEIPADEDTSNDSVAVGYPVAVAEAGQLAQSFEGDFLPYGWSQTANARTWGRSGNPTFQIINYAALMSQDQTHPEEMLITPPLVLDGSITTLSYWRKGVNNAYGAANGVGTSTLQVKYMEVGGTEWTNLGDPYDLGDGEAPVRIEADLSGLANGNYYFAFATTSTWSFTGYTSYVLIDEVVGPDVMTLSTITVNVTDGTDPIEGATVDFGTQTRTTDAAGDAVFGVLDGDYDWAVSAAGYYDATGTLTVAGDATADVALDLMPVAKFVVTDGTDPIEGANVAIEGQDLTTDADGIAMISLADGTYDYTATAAGYYESAAQVTLDFATEDTTIVDVALTIMPVVTFNVTDGTDPLEGVTIDIDGQTLTTDAAGVADASLADGTYAYTANLPGYFETTGEVIVAGADLTEAVTMDIMPVYDLTITVTDGTDPLEGMTVIINDQMLYTDVSGQVVVGGLFDGDYPWVVTDSAYLDSYGTVTIAGADLSADVTLEMIPDGMVLFADDFEGYEVGDLVAENSSYWETWSGASGGGGDDAAVSDDFANSPTKSMIIADGGADDMIFPLGGKTSGLYKIAFYFYVESGADYEGYFNFQGTTTPGDVFAFENYFLQDGTATINVNGEVIYNYTQDSWELMEIIVDLDNDYASMRLNGEYVTSWTYAEDLGGIDIFAGADSGTPKFYVDDISYTDLYFSGGFATFNVTDGTDAIEGAEVSVGGFTLTTDAAGQVVQLLDDGVYDYTVTALGYDDVAGSVTVAAADVTVDVAMVMQYSVTFNLNMTEADFDPANDRVFVSGATADGTAGIGDNTAWPWPQANASFEMFDADEDMIYTVTVPYVSIGDYKYKYGFTTPGNPPNWNNPFPVNDTLDFSIVDADVTVDDAWVGLNEASSLKGFNIYPNPTNGVVTIGTDNQCEVTVTNAIGQVVVNRMVNNNEKLDLSNQTQGLYFITAKTDAEVKTLRLIIE